MRYALLVALATVIAGCAGSDEARCVPGKSDPCACPSGNRGAQVCDRQGSYGPCVCAADEIDALDGDAALDDASDAVVPADAADAALGEVGPDATADAVDEVACDDADACACPTAVITCVEGHAVAAGTRLHCSASGTSADGAAGAITGYQWSLRQPEGSHETLRPSPTQRDIQLDANVVGTYTLVLDVLDARGVRSCAAAEYAVVVVPSDGIYVELTWHTPGDINESDTGMNADGESVGTDLDLHLLHPNATTFFDDRWDAYWLNPNPNWGGAGTDDDPVLEREDTDGAGPESITLRQPELDRSYTVGVHSWEAWAFGPSTAVVRVYIDGQLRFTSDTVGLAEHDLWSVCRIAWPSGEVTAIGGPGGDIVSDYPVPLGQGSAP